MADSAIDFARSSVTWLLPEQPSRGRFSIDAALTVGGETFYLCAQVFAGHVYGDGPLFQDPPYEFSAAFSTTRYRIFRDSVRGAGRDDSFGEHEARFKSIDIDIVRQACGPVPPGKELHAVVARVRTADAELEFPVRHVNSRADGRFQIETGPVLMLEEGEGGPAPTPSLRPSWAPRLRPVPARCTAGHGARGALEPPPGIALRLGIAPG